MSESLNFSQEKFFNFLLSEIATLKSEVEVQKTLTQALFLYLSDNGKQRFEMMQEAAFEHQPLFFQQSRDELIAKLKAISDDFENLIQGLLDQE